MAKTRSFFVRDKDLVSLTDDMAKELRKRRRETRALQRQKSQAKKNGKRSPQLKAKAISQKTESSSVEVASRFSSVAYQSVRHPRTLTAARRKKVAKFMSAFNKNPEAYPAYQSDEWIRKLIAELNEKKHHKPSVNDIKMWMDADQDLFLAREKSPVAQSTQLPSSPAFLQASSQDSIVPDAPALEQVHQPLEDNHEGHQEVEDLYKLEEFRVFGMSFGEYLNSIMEKEEIKNEKKEETCTSSQNVQTTDSPHLEDLTLPRAPTGYLTGHYSNGATAPIQFWTLSDDEAIDEAIELLDKLKKEPSQENVPKSDINIKHRSQQGHA